MADPEGYIFKWLIAYSALLGALAGIMICDYHIVRKTNFDLAGLFKKDSAYKGWNKNAWISFVISILPTLPGFLVAVNMMSSESLPAFLVNLYSYAWFVTFGISFLLYYIMKRKEILK